MSTSAICGENGSVAVGTLDVAEISNFEINISRTPADVPKYGTTRDKLLCGPYEWDGSFSGNWYMTTTNQQKALQDALTGGTTVTLFGYVDATKCYTGTVYITAVNVSVPYDGLVSVTFNYVGTGVLTTTLA